MAALSLDVASIHEPRCGALTVPLAIFHFFGHYLPLTRPSRGLSHAHIDLHYPFTINTTLYRAAHTQSLFNAFFLFSPPTMPGAAPLFTAVELRVPLAALEAFPVVTFESAVPSGEGAPFSPEAKDDTEETEQVFDADCCSG